MSRSTLVWLFACLIGFTTPSAFSFRPLKVRDSAPEFTLPYTSKDMIFESRISEVIGKENIICAFYSADWSGGCTKEMCTMRDNSSGLASLGATVYGISADHNYSHASGRDHNLPFGLPSDRNHDVVLAVSGA